MLQSTYLPLTKEAKPLGIGRQKLLQPGARSILLNPTSRATSQTAFRIFGIEVTRQMLTFVVMVAITVALVTAAVILFSMLPPAAPSPPSPGIDNSGLGEGSGEGWGEGSGEVASGLPPPRSFV